MKIVNLEILKLRREEPLVPKGFWEERFVRPIDLYERFRGEGPWTTGEESPFEQLFLRILADDGSEGFFGPISSEVANMIMFNLKTVILDEDPFGVEKIWDIMYRSQVHGRKGEKMMAISAVDCALWDLIGKAKREPVVRLLGGPVREKVPAYASMLGFSLEPKKVAERCQEYLDYGFRAMKWFFRYGPEDGVRGIERNVNLVKTIRDAVGYNVDLMLDCWMSWSVPYTIRMARLIEKYEITWLEEPLMPDNIEGYVKIRKNINIPIAAGEHEYTRWGARELLKHNAVDILQMDVKWAGGITEMRKICALASAEGIPVIPHAGWVEPAQCIIFSQPEDVCPMIEYLVKWAEIQQAFNREKLTPKKGYFYAPTKIGLGFELQMDKLAKDQ